MVSGTWDYLVVRPHINVLEIMVTLASLHHFINRQGGTRSSNLNDLTARLWRWCWFKDITPVASFIPGQDNLITGVLSRGGGVSPVAVVPPSGDFRPAHVGVVFSVDRPHCLPFQPLASEVMFSGLGSGGIGCLLVPLVSALVLCFLPFHLIPQVLRQIKENEGWVLRIASLAEEVLVPRSLSATSGPPSLPSLVRWTWFPSLYREYFILGRRNSST